MMKAIEALHSHQWKLALQLLRREILEMGSTLLDMKSHELNKAICHPLVRNHFPLHVASIPSVYKFKSFKHHLYVDHALPVYQFVFVSDATTAQAYAPCYERTASMMYNLALTYHLCGLCYGTGAALEKAIQLYKIVSGLLLSKMVHAAASMSDQTKLMQLAIYNNMGSIYSMFGCKQDFHYCLSQMQLLLGTSMLSNSTHDQIIFDPSNETDNPSIVQYELPRTNTLEGHYHFFALSLISALTSNDRAASAAA
jgi:hypothetical protein